MTAERNFAEAEENMAGVFAEAAHQSELKQIVYLGGLGEDNLEKSLHLQSRHNVGKILASGPTPVTELRAAVIIGSGSASFEMLILRRGSSCHGGPTVGYENQMSTNINRRRPQQFT